jgi:hypothetical protein
MAKIGPKSLEVLPAARRSAIPSISDKLMVITAHFG